MRDICIIEEWVRHVFAVNYRKLRYMFSSNTSSLFNNQPLYDIPTTIIFMIPTARPYWFIVRITLLQIFTCRLRSNQICWLETDVNSKWDDLKLKELLYICRYKEDTSREKYEKEIKNKSDGMILVNCVWIKFVEQVDLPDPSGYGVSGTRRAPETSNRLKAYEHLRRINAMIKNIEIFLVDCVF